MKVVMTPEETVTIEPLQLGLDVGEMEVLLAIACVQPFAALQCGHLDQLEIKNDPNCKHGRSEE